MLSLMWVRIIPRQNGTWHAVKDNFLHEMAAYSRSLRPLFIATTASLSWLTTTIIYFFSCSCFMFPGRSRRNCPVFDIQRGIHKHPRQKWKNRSFIILLNVADSLSVFHFCLFVFVLFCFLFVLFFFYFLCLFHSSFKLPQSHWFCRLYVPGKKNIRPRFETEAK